ncbi:putative ammonia channel [Actinorhabdospora filicis]|uniref:Ammonium transporter n=1 Tax=Actinorhabdospora filicis TaxID=1785913 RepID=A0A9W6SHP3_9ACTN|nr:ammonium transporter [Actinorhabdospora filicis]GLZ75676.1 putative ammonia channel [Actinorhabdospora filicis]
MEIDAGNTAWVLVASALVLLMVPGLALFYGGLTRAKSKVNMLMMNLSALAIVSVLWTAYGYSLAFKGTGTWLGDLTAAGMRHLETAVTGTGLPELLFAGFQMMFAAITVALISGAVAERMKFTSWIVFAVIWATLVYFPVAHWVWGGGWIGNRDTGLGALDFAGGTAVHVNAGAAAFGLILVLGKRLGWPHRDHKPHNMSLVLLGTGLLWFGWFGFNAGSELAADGIAALAFTNTQIAAAAGAVAWMAIDWLRLRKPTLLGSCGGAVAGLVAITPACAYVEPLGALAIGVLAGVVCPFAILLKNRLGYDDTLDVVGVHLVAGALGSVLIGVFATGDLVPEGVTAGLAYGGGAGLLGKQTAAVAAVALFSALVAAGIGLVLKLTIGLRVPAEGEAAGIDTHEHDEEGYVLAHETDTPETPEPTAEQPELVGAAK